MPNLKKEYGTFKGLIGECMFKMTERHVFLTRFHPKRKFLEIAKRYVDKNKQEFIEKNWYSLDAVEIDWKARNIVIYEVKTKNEYSMQSLFKPRITYSTLSLYRKAKKLGFTMKTALVLLGDNWEYKVQVRDYSEKSFSMSRPKAYDKKYIQPYEVIDETEHKSVT